MTRCLFIFLLLIYAAPVQAARVEFVGLKSFSSKKLIEALAGRFDYIRKRPATEWRADDAAFLVETYLHSHGLPDALVSGEKISEEIIRLNIKEGLSQFLGTINVTGTSKVEAIQDQFKAPFPETGKRRAFDAEAIDIGLNRIRELLHVDGYWEGTVTGIRGKRNQAGEIPFTLRINKGPLFVLARPTLESSVPPAAELRAALQAAKGKTATAETIVAVRKAISDSYRRRGYSNIDLIMMKETKGNILELSFQLTPGKKYSVRSFQTAGLEKTTTDYIRHRFEKLIGENFDEDYANEEIKKLLATGAFSGIRLETQETANETELDLTLHLKEAKARGYSVALGYGSIEGYILGLRYHDRNLWGSLWNLSAGAEITSLGGLGDVTLTDPFFLDRDLRLSHRAFLVGRDFENYEKLEGGLSSELSWKWGEHYSGAVGLAVSKSAIESPLPIELTGATDYLVTRLSFRQLYDRRDDPSLPSDGWFAQLETSVGLSYEDDSIGFFEIEGQVSYYRTLSEDTSYALGVRGGSISPTVKSSQLPIDLRKFLGGANTIRSFPELEMGPSVGGNALGGTNWWLANAEYMHTVAGPVRGLFFIDAAKLDSDLELAVGLGLRINLPVGPIRLEYGRSLTQDSGEPGGAFHFAIGTTF